MKESFFAFQVSRAIVVFKVIEHLNNIVNIRLGVRGLQLLQFADDRCALLEILGFRPIAEQEELFGAFELGLEFVREFGDVFVLGQMAFGLEGDGLLPVGRNVNGPEQVGDFIFNRFEHFPLVGALAAKGVGMLSVKATIPMAAVLTAIGSATIFADENVGEGVGAIGTPGVTCWVEPARAADSEGLVKLLLGHKRRVLALKPLAFVGDLAQVEAVDQHLPNGVF